MENLTDRTRVLRLLHLAELFWCTVHIGNRRSITLITSSRIKNYRGVGNLQSFKLAPRSAYVGINIYKLFHTLNKILHHSVFLFRALLVYENLYYLGKVTMHWPSWRRRKGHSFDRYYFSCACLSCRRQC